MKIGVVFPQNEIGNDPIAIRDYAQACEEVGCHHILAYDHVLGAHPEREPALTGPYTHEHPFHEPFVLFGHLAAVTTRIELATGILILPQRQTALVAKQAAAVDVLSGGRLRLGVGTGWNTVEYESLGEDWESRGRRMDEQVELMRALWSEPVLDFRGEWHRVDRAGILPLPDQQIPIWFGGFTPVAWRRAARLGDGVVLGWGLGACVAALEATLGFLDAEARSREGFGLEMQMLFKKGPESWAKDIAGWREAGGTHVSVSTMLAGLEKPADHIEAIRRFKEVADGA